MTLQRDLREFIELLNSHGVEYVIAGGHAVAYHGYPRFTGDIDFFVRPTSANGDRLLQVLADFGFGETGLTAEALCQPEKVIQLGRPPNRIDILTAIDGVTFDEAWSGRQHGHIDDLPVPFLGRSELLRNKAASGRPKDLADLDQLRRLR